MRALPLLLPLALLGCDDHLFPRVGDNPGGYDDNWDGVQALMADHCHECHPALAPPDMPTEIEADIVDGTGNWVVPGDPMASELYLVIIGESTETAPMPLGGDLLPEEATDAVRYWIADGALLER